MDKKLNEYCVKCEVVHRKKCKATISVKENGVDIPLCKKCYEEWKAEQEYLQNLKDENYGDFNTEI
jgi:hypothetical protein